MISWRDRLSSAALAVMAVVIGVVVARVCAFVAFGGLW